MKVTGSEAVNMVLLSASLGELAFPSIFKIPTYCKRLRPLRRPETFSIDSSPSRINITLFLLTLEGSEFNCNSLALELVQLTHLILFNSSTVCCHIFMFVYSYIWVCPIALKSLDIYMLINLPCPHVCVS